MGSNVNGQAWPATMADLAADTALLHPDGGVRELYTAAVALWRGDTNESGGFDPRGGANGGSKSQKGSALALFMRVVAIGEEDSDKHTRSIVNAARYSIGIALRDGQGVTQDYETAVSVFEKGAVAGDGAATCELGIMKEGGQGCEVDVAAAVRLYTKAAELGNPGGYLRLGNLYQKGLGVDKSIERAVELYTLCVQTKNGQFQDDGKAFRNSAYNNLGTEKQNTDTDTYAKRAKGANESFHALQQVRPIKKDWALQRTSLRLLKTTLTRPKADSCKRDFNWASCSLDHQVAA